MIISQSIQLLLRKGRLRKNDIMPLYSDDDLKRELIRPYGKHGDTLDNAFDKRDDFLRDFGRLVHSPSFRRLQGKTQLFPLNESDFFRNRLTHSIEVAQIAKGIASYLNTLEPFCLPDNEINLDLIHFAGLSHDLGHPPFGHQGEKALDDCMAEYGGFEGNAQTLRILTRLEKKERLDPASMTGFDQDGKDCRMGLNLTYRSLASIIKYNREIPKKRRKKFTKDIFSDISNNAFEYLLSTLQKHSLINQDGFPIDDLNILINNVNLLGKYDHHKQEIIEWYMANRLVKGFYYTEKEIVKNIRNNISGSPLKRNFKTIECQIMDIADDIAYSTYDLEDALKSNFISIFDILYPEEDVLSFIRTRLNQSNDLDKNNYTTVDVVDIIQRVFIDPGIIEEEPIINRNIFEEDGIIRFAFLKASIDLYKQSSIIAQNGYERTRLTSSLIYRFLTGIYIQPYSKITPLIKIALTESIREEVEVLKNLVYKEIISSNILTIPEYRRYGIIKKVFIALNEPNGYLLLPEDLSEIFRRINDETLKKRIICDYIAGMTDRYIMEFYGRIESENPQTIFKPI
jgi:dGTPase